MLLRGTRCGILMKAPQKSGAEVRVVVDLFVPGEGSFQWQSIETELNKRVFDLDGKPHPWAIRTWMGACMDGARSALKAMQMERDALIIVVDVGGKVTDEGTHWFHLASRVAILRALGGEHYLPPEAKDWEVPFWQIWPIQMDREQHIYHVEGFPQ